MKDFPGFLSKESQIEVKKVSKSQRNIPSAFLKFIPPNLINLLIIDTTFPPKFLLDRFNGIMNGFGDKEVRPSINRNDGYNRLNKNFFVCMGRQLSFLSLDFQYGLIFYIRENGDFLLKN